MRLFPFAAYIIIQLFTFVEVNIRIYRYMKLLLKFSGSCFFLIGIKGIHAVILPSRKEFNVDPPNIHTTWQWTHLRKRLRMCEFVCWWRKCRMCKNRIVEEQKHWRILHENDTKKEDSAKYNKIRVSIGDEYERWTALATCLPHHPFSVIHSSYYTLLGKLRNCSRFIINHVLMAIPPTDNAKHSNSFS